MDKCFIDACISENNAVSCLECHLEKDGIDILSKIKFLT